MDREKKDPLTKLKKTITTSWRLIILVWSTDRKLFSIFFITTVIPSFIPFINAYIFKLLIDYVALSLSGHSLDTSHLFVLLTLAGCMTFIQAVSYKTQEYISNLIWTKMPIKLNQLLLGRISSLDIQHFEDSKFKDLLERVSDTYQFRPQNLITDLMYGLQGMIQVVVALIVLLRLNWIIAVVVMFIAIPQFVSEARQSQLMWAVWHWNSPLKKRYWYLADLLQKAQSIKEIKLYKLAKQFLKDVKTIQQKFYMESSGVAHRYFVGNIFFTAASTLVLSLVSVYVVLQAIARKITIGDIEYYTNVVSNFQDGLSGVFRNMNGVFESSLYVENLFEVLDAKPIIKKAEQTTKIDLTKAPTIEFKDINFTYPGTNKQILRDFSLVVKPGDKIAFVGENGAGKSTIIRLLARLHDVDSGEILINGVNIKEIDLEDWYVCIGVLFQDFNRYEYSVSDNIHFGAIEKQKDSHKIIAAAKEAGADEIIGKLEDSYNQMLGRTFEKGVELSTGQWQKIALARAFFRNAPILVLDEPTAAIDAKAEAEIFEHVSRLSQDKTVFIISHRFSTVRQAHKIYVIDDGKIIESGNHAQLMERDGQYAALFRLQAKGYQ
ncbi:MAG: hypothetical protein RI947_828 [Candidatus Parcubacteria bacterium]|jgi:ABC-type multidrug transport system fused ATPase/permease subunit